MQNGYFSFFIELFFALKKIYQNLKISRLVDILFFCYNLRIYFHTRFAHCTLFDWSRCRLNRKQT